MPGTLTNSTVVLLYEPHFKALLDHALACDIDVAVDLWTSAELPRSSGVFKAGAPRSIRISLARADGGPIATVWGAEGFGRTAVLDDARDCCLLALQLGHFRAWQEGRRSATYSRLIESNYPKRSVWSPQNLTLKERSLIVAEEERAWVFARKRLELIGFSSWEVFEASRRQVLEALQGQLGLSSRPSPHAYRRAWMLHGLQVAVFFCSVAGAAFTHLRSARGPLSPLAPMASIAAAVASFLWMRSFRCPRCRQHFYGFLDSYGLNMVSPALKYRPVVFRRACACCELPTNFDASRDCLLGPRDYLPWRMRK